MSRTVLNSLSIGRMPTHMRRVNTAIDNPTMIEIFRLLPFLLASMRRRKNIEARKLIIPPLDPERKSEQHIKTMRKANMTSLQPFSLLVTMRNSRILRTLSFPKCINFDMKRPRESGTTISMYPA